MDIHQHNGTTNIELCTISAQGVGVHYYNNKRKPQSEIAGTQSVGVMVSGAHNLDDSSQVVNNYWW